MKTIPRFLIYFIVTFAVVGLFYMGIYPAVIPSGWMLFEHTWLQTFQVSACMAITVTYGDYREDKAINDLKDGGKTEQ